jgi:hypothetical protein
LAHEIANNGKPLYEKQAGEYDAFISRSLISRENIKKIYQEQRQNINKKLQVLGA